jgi:hypothetical protein
MLIDTGNGVIWRRSSISLRGLKLFDMERTMRTNYFRTLLTVASAAVLCAATFISSQSPSALAETKKPTKGQDVADKDCERIDGPESSTFGKCGSVCKDKDVTWDAVGRRYVCNASKAIVRRPFGQVAPVGGVLTQDTGTKKPPKYQSGDKAVKAKKKSKKN